MKNINGKFYWELSISHIISLRFIRTFPSKIVQTKIKVGHQRMPEKTADPLMTGVPGQQAMDQFPVLLSQLFPHQHNLHRILEIV